MVGQLSEQPPLPLACLLWRVVALQPACIQERAHVPLLPGQAPTLSDPKGWSCSPPLESSQEYWGGREGELWEVVPGKMKNPFLLMWLICPEYPSEAGNQCLLQRTIQFWTAPNPVCYFSVSSPAWSQCWSGPVLDLPRLSHCPKSPVTECLGKSTQSSQEWGPSSGMGQSIGLGKTFSSFCYHSAKK